MFSSGLPGLSAGWQIESNSTSPRYLAEPSRYGGSGACSGHNFTINTMRFRLYPQHDTGYGTFTPHLDGISTSFKVSIAITSYLEFRSGYMARLLTQLQAKVESLIAVDCGTISRLVSDLLSTAEKWVFARPLAASRPLHRDIHPSLCLKGDVQWNA